MMQHLLLLPILVPLITGALMLLLERRHEIRIQRIAAWTGMLALLATSLALFARASSGEVDVYLLGDWPARLGIVLMLDRLGAWMVLITALLALPCLLHACAGWDKRALHFHALFQLQLAGLNGAFLTGDLFNLFVFFEVMLSASYGLLLSGSRGPRIKAGMHYVVFNICASTLFLMALAVLYSVLGTLNMAEMAARIAQAPPEQAALIKAGGGLLLLVFCAKAALLPMYMWLPDAYSRAPATVAALFAIMTKVGLYAMLRVGSLLFGSLAGTLADFAQPALLAGGALTLVLAALGVMGAARLRVAVAYLVLLSAGTLFIAFALKTPATLSAGLYYLMHSVFVTAALFLLADLILRVRGDTGELLREIAPIANKPLLGGLFLIAALSVAGIPPLSGFIGKLALLSAMDAAYVGKLWPPILIGSLLSIIGLASIGTRLFWRVEKRPQGDVQPPPLRRKEITSVLMLLGYGIGLTVAAEPVMEYARTTAEQLLQPAAYLDAVRTTLPLLREPAP